VITGVMEQEATALNCFFMTAHRRHRPYIILKWAQSEDGFIDRKRNGLSEKPVLFSTPLTRMMVHQLRAEVQAIMAGTNTAMMDNPSLTVRHWQGRSPVRVLIDRNRRVPRDYHLFDGRQPTLVFTKPDMQTSANTNYQDKVNVKYLKIMEKDFSLNEIVAFLYKNEIYSLLVEGGACLHRSFIAENLWDELIIETAPIRLLDGVKAPDLPVHEDVQLVDKQFVSCRMTSDEQPCMITRYLNGSI